MIHLVLNGFDSLRTFLFFFCVRHYKPRCFTVFENEEIRHKLNHNPQQYDILCTEYPSLKCHAHWPVGLIESSFLKITMFSIGNKLELVIR